MTLGPEPSRKASGVLGGTREGVRGCQAPDPVPPVCFTCPEVGRGTQEGAKGCQALVPVHLKHQPGSALPRRVPLGVVRAQVEPPRALRRIREQCPNVTRVVMHPMVQSIGRRRG